MTSFVYVESKPDTQLRDYVRTYWRFERTFKPGEMQTIYPDSCYEILWVERGVLLVDGEPAPRLFLGGCRPQPILLSSPGAVEVWAVRFNPWGLIPFASPQGVSSVAKTSAIENMDAQTYADFCELFEAATQSTLSRLLDKYLLERLVATRIPTLLEAATPHLQQQGSARIRDIAQSAQVSLRHLERLIHKATGNTPRDIRARIRFEHARRELLAISVRSLTEIAVDCGYSDQSHLVKDFRRFTGMPPLQFRELYLTTYAHVLTGRNIE